jgi:hypothetical protein
LPAFVVVGFFVFVAVLVVVVVVVISLVLMVQTFVLCSACALLTLL